MIQSQVELLFPEQPHPVLVPSRPLPLPPQQERSRMIQIQLLPEQELL